VTVQLHHGERLMPSNAFPLRLDEALRKQLEAAASESLRSANKEILFRLRQSFEREREPDEVGATS
jgi:hypothetical protein